ncbi:hypothetical protein V2O64_17415 [Verrucomicrobiaceae bacterium 227]
MNFPHPKRQFFLVLLTMAGWVLNAAEKQPKIQTAMPPGINYFKAEDNSHRYEIRNIYTLHVPEQMRSNEILEEALTGAFPADLKIANQIALDIDLQRKTFALVSPRKLTSEEITDLLNPLAGDRLLPSWHELLAREFPKSKIFKDHQFLANEVNPEPSKEFIWSEQKRLTPLRMPLSLGKNNQGQLELTPSCRYCICHSYFTLRILDKQGGIIWKSSDHLFKGLVKVSLEDSDSDGWQEIYLDCDDHGKEKRFKVSHQGKD